MIDQNKYLKKIRRLPSDVNFSTNSLRIWDDTINIVSEDEQDFVIITLKDKFVSHMFKSMFDFMWSRSQPFSPTAT
jgi:hypothetical protein